ncbi:MAG: radical SAM protein, partial [Pseudonocardiaceae bacterium]
ADLPTMLRVVEHLRTRYGLQEVVLAGLQPLLDDELLWFIRALKGLGIHKISMTSHGLRLIEWLPRLKDAGLDALVLSVQGFSRRSYQAVMDLDEFGNALSVMDLAKGLGLIVAINRVVLRGSQDDIPDFLDCVRGQGLWVRLYDLMWNPGHDEEFLKYHISWQELIPLWEAEVQRITVWDWARRHPCEHGSGRPHPHDSGKSHPWLRSIRRGMARSGTSWLGRHGTYPPRAGGDLPVVTVVSGHHGRGHPCRRRFPRHRCVTRRGWRSPSRCRRGCRASRGGRW